MGMRTLYPTVDVDGFPLLAVRTVQINELDLYLQPMQEDSDR